MLKQPLSTARNPKGLHDRNCHQRNDFLWPGTERRLLLFGKPHRPGELRTIDGPAKTVARPAEGQAR
jgi:hypothetical protein